jgi:hypothetical protein
LTAEIFYANSLQYEKVSYYTVKVIGKPVSEYEQFFTCMNSKESQKRQLAIINRFIMQMGRIYGASESFFKYEPYVKGALLPAFGYIKGNGYTDLCTRLYCIRVNEQIVILLNGGCKTMKDVIDCDNCRPHFELAAKISDAISLARQQGNIGVDGMELLVENDFLLEV